ncbi:MAG TPA: flagellar motor switch protein FliM [Firmicutes bacterium]|nr:flagellar motor switch protein FliM [Bacillota bacterium]
MSDILSQDEINALLSSLMEEQEPEAASAPAPAGPKDIKPYDFRRPDKFSKVQLRTLEMLHDTFARHLSTALSTYLRTPIKVTLTLVEQLTFDEFISSLPALTVIASIDMSPLDGRAVLEINPAVAFSMIDRLLGGTGRFEGQPREFTDLEQMLMKKILARVVDNLAGAWSNLIQLEPSLENMETNPQFIQVMSPNDSVSVLAFEVSAENMSGTMSLCLPYLTLQPIIPRLGAQQWFAEGRRGIQESKKLALRKEIERVKLPVSVEVGRATITVRELLELEPGDIIKLDRHAPSDFKVFVGSGAKFLGRPGLVGRHLAVEITAFAGTAEGANTNNGRINGGALSNRASRGNSRESGNAGGKYESNGEGKRAVDGDGNANSDDNDGKGDPGAQSGAQ